MVSLQHCKLRQLQHQQAPTYTSNNSVSGDDSNTFKVQPCLLTLNFSPPQGKARCVTRHVTKMEQVTIRLPDVSCLSCCSMAAHGEMASVSPQGPFYQQAGYPDGTKPTGPGSLAGPQREGEQLPVAGPEDTLPMTLPASLTIVPPNAFQGNVHRTRQICGHKCLWQNRYRYSVSANHNLHSFSDIFTHMTHIDGICLHLYWDFKVLYYALHTWQLLESCICTGKTALHRCITV